MLACTCAGDCCANSKLISPRVFPSIFLSFITSFTVFVSSQHLILLCSSQYPTSLHLVLSDPLEGPAFCPGFWAEHTLIIPLLYISGFKTPLAASSMLKSIAE